MELTLNLQLNMSNHFVPAVVLLLFFATRGQRLIDGELDLWLKPFFFQDIGSSVSDVQ